MMTHLICLFIVSLLFLLLPFTALANDNSPTVISDPSEAQILLGRHLLEEYSLSETVGGNVNENFGEVRINDKYHLTGQHICYQRDYEPPFKIFGGYIKIDGHITRIDKSTFQLDGKITEARYGGGKIYRKCQATGNLKFSRTRHAAYWRLQNRPGCLNQNFSNIDIFVAPLENTAPHPGCAFSIKDAQKMLP